MKKGWQRVPLGEVARVQAGDPAPQGAEDFTPNGTPFVRMQDVGRYGKTTRLVDTKDRVASHVSARMTVFPAGSVLVPKSGASIRLNHRAILGIDAHVVSHLAIIQAGSRLNNHFLYYWLSSVDLSRVAHDADMPSLKTSDLAAIPVPVPPVPEQDRIVEILDDADALRQLRQQADCRTAALLPALFHEMFGDPAINPKRWPILPLERLIAIGPQNGLYKPAAEYGDGTPILRINNFYDGFVTDITALRRLRVSDVERERYRLQEGDLVINRVNSIEYLGKSALIPSLPETTIFECNMMRFSLDTAQLNQVYLIQYLQTETAKRRLRAGAKLAINQASINQTDVKGLPVPVPPVSLQREFAVRVGEVRALEQRQAESRRRLAALFASLLDRAFKGEL